MSHRSSHAALSLVLNFVGDPARRGEMLAKCAALLPVGGLLFFVLPSACVENSRLALPFVDLSLPFHCLSLTSRCRSTASR